MTLTDGFFQGRTLGIKWDCAKLYSLRIWWAKTWPDSDLWFGFRCSPVISQPSDHYWGCVSAFVSVKLLGVFWGWTMAVTGPVCKIVDRLVSFPTKFSSNTYTFGFPGHQISIPWVSRLGLPSTQSISIWQVGNTTQQSTIVQIGLLNLYRLDTFGYFEGNLGTNSRRLCRHKKKHRFLTSQSVYGNETSFFNKTSGISSCVCCDQRRYFEQKKYIYLTLCPNTNPNQVVFVAQDQNWTLNLKKNNINIK